MSKSIIDQLFPEVLTEENSTHDQFYSQFVDQQVINYVSAAIGVDRIKASKDEFLNDIPLKEWDALKMSCVVSWAKWRMATDANHMTMSQNVCLAKAAANQIKNGRLA